MKKSRPSWVYWVSSSANLNKKWMTTIHWSDQNFSEVSQNDKIFFIKWQWRERRRRKAISERRRRRAFRLVREPWQHERELPNYQLQVWSLLYSCLLLLALDSPQALEVMEGSRAQWSARPLALKIPSMGELQEGGWTIYSHIQTILIETEWDWYSGDTW